MTSVRESQLGRLFLGQQGQVLRHIGLADNVSRDDHGISNTVRSLLDSVGGHSDQPAAKFLLRKHSRHENVGHCNRFYNHQIPVHGLASPLDPSPRWEVCYFGNVESIIVSSLANIFQRTHPRVTIGEDA